LEFDPKLNKVDDDKELRHGLSVALQIGDTLWVANDETISLERLSREKGDTDSDHKYGKHRQFDLSTLLTLPDPPEDGEKVEEIDIEGVDLRDGYIWLTGSHSLKRKKADKKTVAKNFEQLRTVTSDGNRFLLARIPLVEKDGAFTLEKSVEEDGKTRIAARVDCNIKSSKLTEALAEDQHLGPFLKIPGKDNGFDIEGLAVTGDGHVFLGLRGPVLRGWAVILELRLETEEDNPEELKLKSVKSGGPVYHKHFLDLGGLGIRDLCLQGSDLLILAGPTMDLDGPVTVFRWKDGARPEGESLIQSTKLQKVMDIPYGEGDDHAEGITLFSPDGGEASSLLVVYDSASSVRQTGVSGLKVDLFALPT